MELTTEEWRIVRAALRMRMADIMRSMRYERQDNLQAVRKLYDKVREVYLKVDDEKDA